MGTPCLINVTGTSGEATIRFRTGTVFHTITSTIGSFYIDSGALDVTYTTISGNAIASSSCFVVSSLPIVCYKINWKGIITDDYKFDAVLFGLEILNLDFIPFLQIENLVTNLNSKNDSRIKVIDFKTEPSQNANSTEYSFIVKVFNSNIPIFRIKNKDNTGSIYLHGEVYLCENVGSSNVRTNSNSTNLLN